MAKKQKNSPYSSTSINNNLYSSIKLYGPGPASKASPLMGYRGQQIISAGYFYAPYIPMQSCPTINLNQLRARRFISPIIFGSTEFIYNGQVDLIESVADIEVCGVSGLLPKDGLLSTTQNIINPTHTKMAYVLDICLHYMRCTGLGQYAETLWACYVATNGDVYWLQAGDGRWPCDGWKLSPDDKSKIYEAIAAWNEENLTDRDGQDS